MAKEAFGKLAIDRRGLAPGRVHLDRYSVEAIVIGAGVVGLAMARRLAMAGLETLVIEKHEAIGMETSSRNSEVIHAGLYYPKGSIKALACKRGKELLYAYCAARGVPHRRCGKLMVASREEQLPKLQALWDAATDNGIHDLAWISADEARELEPDVLCVKGFLSPSTGIIDSHGLMLAYHGDLEAHGGLIAFNTPVLAIRPSANGFVLAAGGDAPSEVETRLLVNCAGHGAPKLAAEIPALPATARPRQWYAKGNYFSLAGRQPFSRLVYPMPEAAGLGVHATLDLQGRCRFGPDVEWVDREDDLQVSAERVTSFYDAIRAYWPGLPDGALQADYAGIRPKLHGPDSPMPDFRIDGPADHGLEGLVNMFGIESPGLTASMALADIAARKLALPEIDPLG